MRKNWKFAKKTQKRRKFQFHLHHVHGWLSRVDDGTKKGIQQQQQQAIGCLCVCLADKCAGITQTHQPNRKKNIEWLFFSPFEHAKWVCCLLFDYNVIWILDKQWPDAINFVSFS